ncbi:AraC family transcriptional regulator [Sphaerisporangium krabiense]|uniref:TatD DNase family protein n=1 Tax=Sphaerisporangium krabiense TaxID=763782 RepID=A0A7W9DRC1_9ACTN|nr:TatD family hydrolase [Sphaerisporangium krabiense]MBB5627235.1 TatD DNase family protein [Sphaerisporangium krabiense]GII64632.1 AraC family transcriptional regulator [Sphaerisporangium krabiense]
MSQAVPPAPEPLGAEVFDSHCHLDIMVGERKASSGDAVALAAQASGTGVGKILAEAREVGVTRLVTIGYDLRSSRWGAQVARERDDVYAGVAIHPNEAHAATPEVLDEIEKLAREPQVRAVGETGLDFFRDWASREDQEASFRAHIEIAKRTGKALVIHDRDAHDDVLRVLADAGAPEVVVFHSYSGDAAMARRCVEAGYFMSFSGPVTYKNAGYLREAAELAPPELMLVETDAPYLPPTPHRGKPNAPYLIPLTLRCLAEVKGMDADALARAVDANGERVFGAW